MEIFQWGREAKDKKEAKEKKEEKEKEAKEQQDKEAKEKEKKQTDKTYQVGPSSRCRSVTPPALQQQCKELFGNSSDDSFDPMEDEENEEEEEEEKQIGTPTPIDERMNKIVRHSKQL